MIDPSDHLFRREAGRMVATLTRIFGVHNLALAEDVVLGPIRDQAKRLCNASFAAVEGDDHCAIAIATVRVTPTDRVDISTSVETVSRDRRHNPVCSRATKF